MNVYAVLALCFIPFLAAFIIADIIIPGIKIRHELWATVLALFSVLPIIFIQFALHDIPIFNSSTLLGILITALFFNGFIEELLKTPFILLFPSKKLTLPVFFTLGIIFGLAFGCFESGIYFLQNLQKTRAGAELLYAQIFERMFSAVIIHALCTGLSSLYIWSLKNKHLHIVPLFWAIILHGLYNFFTESSGPYNFLAIITILFALTECRLWYKKLSKTKNNY